jgi:hypothetical protein
MQMTLNVLLAIATTIPAALLFIALVCSAAVFSTTSRWAAFAERS